MKFLTSILLIVIISCALQLFLPWWSLAIAVFIIGLALLPSAFSSFLAGFLGTALVWWSYSLIIQMQTPGLLAEKIAVLFKVGSPFLLLLLGGLIAGLVGGFAALSGTLLRNIISNR